MSEATAQEEGTRVSEPLVSSDEPATLYDPGPEDVGVAQRRASGLDMSLGQTLAIYIIMVLIVGRYTVMPWLGTGGPGESPFAPLLNDPWVSLTATLAALFIHYLPFMAYKKAKLLEEDLDAEQRVSIRLLDRANRLSSDQSAELDRQGIDNLYRVHFANLIASEESRTAAARILEDVLNRARMLRFEPTAGVVAPYRTEFAARLPEIAKYQRISLQLGIMFTFFGLMMVFSGSAFSASVTTSSASTMASQLIGGLNLAFGGSVAGLIASIVVILFLDHLRRHLVTVGRLHERLAEQVTAVAHRAFNDPALRDNLVALENVLRRTESQLDNVRRDLAGSNEASASLLASVERSVPGVTSAVSKLDQSLRNLGTRHEQLVETMLKGYSVLTPDRVGDQIYKALSKGLDETNAQLRESARAIKELRTVVAEIETAYANTRTDSVETRRALRKIERELSRLRPSQGFWRLPAWLWFWRRR